MGRLSIRVPLLVSVLQLTWILPPNPVFGGGTLSLNDYLQQVRKHSPSRAAKLAQSEAATMNQESIDYMLAPGMSINASRLSNKQPGEVGSPRFESLDSLNYGVAVSKQFSFGTRARFSFDISDAEMKNMRFSQGQPGQNFGQISAVPGLEISQPLWQNAFGRGIDMQRRALAAESKSQKAEVEAYDRTLEVEAKIKYFAVIFAKERVKIAERTLDTAAKILNFVKTRFEQNLYEKSDFLQAQALVSSRELELQMAEQALKSSLLDFNTMRGQSELTADVELEGTLEETHEKIDSVNIDARPELEMIESKIEALRAAADLEVDKSAPIFDLFASYSLKSDEDKIGSAISNVKDPYNPKSVIGLTIKFSLDPRLSNSATRVARLRTQSAEYQRDELKQNLGRGLVDLQQNLASAQKSYQIANQLFQIQKSRLENQQIEFRNGRSTTYQMLLSTQELAQAELGKLQAAFQALMTELQLSLYRGAK